MIFYMGVVANSGGTMGTFRSQLWGVEDEWTAKDIRNYDCFNDSRCEVIPNNYNKLPEATAWKMAQPPYMSHTPEKYLMSQFNVFFPKERKTVQWVYFKK